MDKRSYFKDGPLTIVDLENIGLDYYIDRDMVNYRFINNGGTNLLVDTRSH